MSFLRIQLVTLWNESRQHLYGFSNGMKRRAIESYEGHASWYNERTECATDTASALHSFKNGMISALSRITPDSIVFFFEDDDWYSPDHITKTLELFEPSIDIVGQTNRYYHVPKAMYLEHKNDRHSSLCSTAIRASVIPEFLEIIQQANGPLVDMMLWRKLYAEGRGRVEKLDTCVGLKGMTRLGLGPGHSDKSVTMKKYLSDPDRKVMRDWMGDDCELIMEVCNAR
jgi:hypothetical protein